MEALSEAFRAADLSYSFAISPHPAKKDTFRLVLSRPTNKHPESVIFLSIDIFMTSNTSDVSTFEAKVENMLWTLPFTVEKGRLKGFSESYMDKIWSQKEVSWKTKMYL
ncbi:unnamed protein product [Phytomonas sp. EM1]|nr:unnamed protein product [Phytomonas sp. EM1]|eukprot:CCW63476.1 unnamed protein product [Phytomonas sp. isolate EM1]